MRLGFDSPPQEKIWLIVIMTAGLINGLLHTFLVPPWQHYDEPGHFEYAWLIANKPGLPEQGDYVQAMRREVAASMIEHDFFANMGFRPNLLSITEPIWIGISQISDQPVYYMIVAIPLYFVRFSDITFQLYIGRLVSVGLFLLTIFGSYAITSELTKPGSSLRLLVPATVALMPAFADIMTAVNDDVGAATFFTLFLWMGVRMQQRGITWINSIFLILLAFICILTKSTTLFAIPLTLIALTISLLPQDKRIYGWIGLSFTGIILLGLSITFDGVAFWHIRTGVNQVQRVFEEISPDGQNALEIKLSDSNSPSDVVQLIPEMDLANIRGKSVTIGAWIWASSAIQTRTPVLDDGTNTFYETIEVDTVPGFYTNSVVVDEYTKQLLVRLQNLRQPEDFNGSVYFDGIILVEGDYSKSEAPSFLTPNHDHVEWGGEKLINYIRNASFEKTAPQFRTRIDDVLANYLRDRLSLVISSFVDFEAYRTYYPPAIQHLFRSFWAVFGWGQVYLVGSKPYRILLIISLIALIGDFLFIQRRRRALPLHSLGFLGLALLGVWAMAATRGVSSVFSRLFIPAARYAYPVIVPTVLLFVVGWREILKIIGERLNFSSTLQYAAYISLLLILNGISFYSIWLYYHAS